MKLTQETGPLCAIDVGTNSVKCLVAHMDELGGIEPVLDTMSTTRLGEGLHGSDTLGPVPMQRTARAVADFVQTARRAGSRHIRVTGTSAVREAVNALDFRDQVRLACGMDVEVLDGIEEARLSYLGAVGAASRSTATLDIGGGSTEWACGESGALSWQRSYPMGAVRLTEAFLVSDPPSETEVNDAGRALEALFHDAPYLEGTDLVGIGGTFHGLASVSLKGAGEVEGCLLSVRKIRSLRQEIISLPTIHRREIPGMPANRADILPAGAMIAESALLQAGADHIRCTCRGLRHGSLLQLAGSLFQPLEWTRT